MEVPLSGGTNDLGTLALKSKYGRLAIKASPSSSAFTLAGSRGQTIRTGITPATVKIPPGSYTLALKKEGYAPLTFKINLARNDRQTLDKTQATLRKLQGDVIVSSTPYIKGATVLVNGKKQGRIPLSLILAEGSHEIEVKTEGKTGKKQVTVKDGDSTVVKVPLEETHPSNGARSLHQFNRIGIAGITPVSLKNKKKQKIYDQLAQQIYDAMFESFDEIMLKPGGARKKPFPIKIFMNNEAHRLVPGNVEALEQFHHNLKVSGDRFLTGVAMSNDAEIIAYGKISKRNFDRFLNKEERTFLISICVYLPKTHTTTIQYLPVNEDVLLDSVRMKMLVKKGVLDNLELISEEEHTKPVQQPPTTEGPDSLWE